MIITIFVCALGVLMVILSAVGAMEIGSSSVLCVWGTMVGTWFAVSRAHEIADIIELRRDMAIFSQKSELR